MGSTWRDGCSVCEGKQAIIVLTETKTENVNSMTTLVIEHMKAKPNAASYPVIII